VASAASVVEARACGIAVAVRSKGGEGPPRVTVETKPAFCRARARERCRFVEGMDVRPSRALEAFWRCEQTCARFTRDIVFVCFERSWTGGCLCGSCVVNGCSLAVWAWVWLLLCVEYCRFCSVLFVRQEGGWESGMVGRVGRVWV